VNTRRPIFTRSAECQDCYKCVRACPVKAIRVRDGHASVEPETCIYCGTCVSVCPSSAKKVRDDLPRVRHLLATKSRVYASLAPSFVAALAEWKPEELLGALQELGFTGVSETALGAEIVSREVKTWFEHAAGSLQISSACPVVVDLVTKYYPALARRIRTADPEAIVVFVGPCLAKKREAAESGVIDYTISFEELGAMLVAHEIDVQACEAEAADTLGQAAGRGFPVTGGVSAAVTAALAHREDVTAAAIDGIDADTARILRRPGSAPGPPP
jgi:iron only hydrogenase large subunit-like protein